MRAKSQGRGYQTGVPLTPLADELEALRREASTACYREIVKLCAKLYAGPVDQRSAQYKEQNTSTFIQEFNKVLNYKRQAAQKNTSQVNMPQTLVEYAKWVNTIAAQWDIGIRKAYCKKHGVKNPEKDSAYLVPEHRFLLTVFTKEQVEAEDISRHLPPDRRVVIIRVPERLFTTPETLWPLIFHDVGHFLGVRHRNNARHAQGYGDEQREPRCREEYYILAVTDRICAQLLSALSKAIPDPATFAIAGRYVNSILEEVRRDLYRAYNTRKHQYRQAWEEQAENEHPDIIRQMTAGIDRGYFGLIGAVMDIAVEDFFMHSKKKYIELASSHSEQIGLVIAEVWNSTELSLSGDNGHNFHAETIALLAEPVADMFMVKALDMTRNEYLLLVFEQYTKPGYTEEIVRNILLAETVKTRITSILATFDRTATKHADLDEPSVAARLKRIAADWGTTKDEIEEQFRFFEEEIMQHQRRILSLDGAQYTNHLYRLMELSTAALWVHEYVRQIARDERYEDKRLRQRIKSIDEIRKQYKKACGQT